MIPKIKTNRFLQVQILQLLASAFGLCDLFVLSYYYSQLCLHAQARTKSVSALRHFVCSCSFVLRALWRQKPPNRIYKSFADSHSRFAVLLFWCPSMSHHWNKNTTNYESIRQRKFCRLMGKRWYHVKNFDLFLPVYYQHSLNNRWTEWQELVGTLC